MADIQQTHKQIVDRYNAKKAIFQAMVNGRHISLLDSVEFEVSQMHTTICNIRKDIEQKKLPYILMDGWISFGKHGKKCKEYWLVEKKSDIINNNL